jgi:tetratricopeptide (TPR) repeat protein
MRHSGKVVAALVVLVLGAARAHGQAAVDFLGPVPPHSALEALGRGLQWRMKHDPDKAIAAYGDAIRSAPGFFMGYFNRGEVWAEKREFDKAIADFDAAIRLQPQFAPAYSCRGQAWELKHDLDKAIADYNEAIKLDHPFKAQIHVVRGDLWRDKGDLDQAMTDYKEAIRLAPKNPMAYTRRGLAWQAMGDFDKAIADHDRAIRLEPKNPLSRVDRARAWHRKGDFKKAMADCTEAIRLDRGCALALGIRGAVRGSTGDFERAIADCNEGVRLDPKESAGYAGRAWIWATAADARYRDGKRAVESATRACELNDWLYPRDLSTLAAACAEAGDFAAAVKWQDKALALGKDEKERVKDRARLELYRATKPYREQPPAK